MSTAVDGRPFVMGGCRDGLPRAALRGLGSVRPCCATGSSRPRTRPASSTTTCRPTTSSPTTRRARAAASAAIFLEATAVAPDRACSRRTRSAATCPGSSARLRAARRGRPRATARGSSCSSSTAGGSSSPTRRARPPSRPRRCRRPRFHAEPRALTQRRDRRAASRAYATGRAARPRGRHRRHRGLDGPRLSGRAVLHRRARTTATTATTARSRPGCASPRGARARSAPRSGATSPSACACPPTSSRRTATAPAACAEIAAALARDRARRLRLRRARPLGHLPRLDVDRPAAARAAERDRRPARATCAPRGPGVPHDRHDADRGPRRTPSASSAGGRRTSSA